MASKGFRVMRSAVQPATTKNIVVSGYHVVTGPATAPCLHLKMLHVGGEAPRCSVEVSRCFGFRAVGASMYCRSVVGLSSPLLYLRVGLMFSDPMVYGCACTRMVSWLVSAASMPSEPAIRTQATPAKAPSPSHFEVCLRSCMRNIGP